MRTTTTDSKPHYSRPIRNPSMRLSICQCTRPVLVSLVLLLVLLPSRTVATILVNENLYPSMPAVFGVPWYPNVVYTARLQTVFENPTLCTNKIMSEPPQDRKLRSSAVVAASDHVPIDERRNHAILSSTEIIVPSDSLPVALLVKRGDCSFEEKARNAMELSDAIQFVIVYDDNLRSQLVPMSANDPSEISVRLLFISHTAGLEIASIIKAQAPNVTEAGGTLIQMDSKLPLWPVGPDYQQEQDWLLAAMAGFFTFLACFGCMLVAVMAGYIPADGRFVVGGHTIVTAPRALRSRRLLTPEQVELFPQEAYTCAQNQEEERACAICIEEYQEGEMLRVLPCSHMFHHDCLVPWLCERQACCPLCKHDIVGPDEERQREEDTTEEGGDSHVEEGGSDDSDASGGSHTRPSSSPWGWWTRVSRSAWRRPIQVPTDEATIPVVFETSGDSPSVPAAVGDDGSQGVPVRRAESA